MESKYTVVHTASLLLVDSVKFALIHTFQFKEVFIIVLHQGEFKFLNL